MADAEFDISQLTEEQQLALQQYTSVTDQQLAEAIPILERCYWNVQVAITRFFDGEPVQPVEAPPESIPPPPQTSRRQDTLANGFTQTHSTSSSRRPVYFPAPRVVGTPSNHLNHEAPLFLSLFLAPVNTAYALFARLFGFLFRLFPFIPRYIARFAARATTTRSHFTSGQRRPLGPQDTTSRFLREFEEEYGQHSLPLLDVSYARAFDLAKNDLKFLLVIPLSPEHDATNSFVRNILLSQPVADFLANLTSNVLLWSGTISDSETFQVADALHLTTFPSCALVVHTPSVSSTAMSVILRLQPGSSTSPGTRAFSTPENFVAALQASITQNSAALSRVRAQRSEQQASRDIRDQQNSAYERSLAQDRERARQRREAEAAQQRQEQEAADRQAQEEKAELERRTREERLAENLRRWRRWRVRSLQTEPAAADKSVSRISIRLPSGERLTRRFAGETSLEEVYAFVECHEYIQDEGHEDEKDTEPPTDFKHEYDFRLVSPMPREVYALEDGGTVKDKIGRSGNLIVERIEEQSHEEEGGTV